MPSPNILFVTGTDTGCGKTTVSLKILAQYRRHGLKTIALKPVASGANPHNEDALALRNAATLPLTVDQVNPYCFKEPIAPHIAAMQAGVTIDLDRLVQQVDDARRQQPDLILIEGAGGWLVPLGEALFFRDLVRAVDAQVLLVVGMKLGCLNHALLTHRAMMADNVRIAGWAASIFDPHMAALEANLMTLEHAFGAPAVSLSERDTLIPFLT